MYACIYVPRFPVQAIVRAEPALRAKAVAVIDGTPPLCRVMAANQKAFRAGVKLGLSKLAAAQLPDLMVRQRSLAQEAAADAALLDLGLAFSPRVEAIAPDTVTFDGSGLEQLFGAPETIARNLVRRASALGFKTQVGVAANIDAAVHAARGFRGITVIPEDQEAEALSTLPLEVLSAPPESLETLGRWGVRTFRALAALPTAQLSERLGQEGVRLQATARGGTSRPLVPVEPALKFEEVMELEYPVTTLEPLTFILGRMLDQLCQRLEGRALATNELRLGLSLESAAPDLQIGTGDSGLGSGAPPPPTASRSPSPRGRGKGVRGGSQTRILRLPVSMRNPKLLLKLWLLHLKADPPPAPVLKVTLAAEPAKPRLAQGGLFLPLSPDPEKLEVTLARIAGAVGVEHLGSPELEDSHRPDAFRMNRFDSSALGTGKRKTRIANRELRIAGLKSHFLFPDDRFPIRGSRNLMALRVFRPPRPAVVEVKNGYPVRVYAPGIRGDVVALSGPWRTSGCWWRDDSWAEDEWDVGIRSLAGPLSMVEPLESGLVRSRTTDQKTTAGFYRIYRELTNGNWFIRGVYD